MGIIVVPKNTAAAVARHYGLDVRKLRTWLRETPNASLLGTMESPAMRATVERFLAESTRR